METAERMIDAELKRARTWLIAIGLIQFTFDIIFTHTVENGLSDGAKTTATIIACARVAAFLALAFYTTRAPVLCLGLGLALYWAGHAVAAAIDPGNLTKGLLIKGCVTAGLVHGLMIARLAEQLRRKQAEALPTATLVS